MTVTSLNALVAAGYAQRSLGATQSKLAASIAHMASGRRINSAFEDIAALSVATGLQSEVTTLRSAALNVAQASSMLQVADGGMSQIGNILDRMQALSVQANSGALDSAARQGLNTEFQALADEIDRLSGNTNFNGVNLLNGNLAQNGQVTTSTDVGTQATGSLVFTGLVGAGQTVNINGVTLTEGVDFAAGGTVSTTVQNLANALNNSTDTRLSGATFTANGQTLDIEFDAAGEAGNQFIINEGASTAAASFTVGGDQLGASTIFSLQGGTDGSISAGSTTVSGSAGNNLFTSQSQSGATSTINFNNAADIQNGDTLQVDDGNGGFVTFTFTAGAPVAATDIQIGSTLEETLQNAATTLDEYTGTDDFGIRQLDFSVNGNALEITSEQPGNPTDAAGAALNLNLGTAGGSISNTTLNNGTSTGVDVSNVTNEAFTGTIQGFTAQFNGADSITASITIGDETYTAQITDTTPTANTTVRFTSENGGFFDVDLAANNGSTVNNQTGANTFANRLDAAFSTLDFTQERDVTSFNPTGQLFGASMRIEGQDFSNLSVDNISVTESLGGGSAVAEITINGETFRANNIGTEIGAGETIEFQSVTNPSRTLSFTNGDNDINLSTSTDARNFQTALEDAFDSGGGTTFQIGSTPDDALQLTIGNANTETLFGGASLDILSSANASAAYSVIGNAINLLTSYRADVGASQQSLNFAGSNIESAIQNQEAARATLQDTDYAFESTQKSLLEVLQQSSIATLAQSNRMQANILKLIG